MHSPAYEVVLDRQSPLFDDCASLRFGIHLDPTVPMRQLIDGCLGDTWNWTRLLAGSRFGLRAVSLPHTPIASPRRYREIFGAPVFFAHPYAGLNAPKGFIERDLGATNPMLRTAAIEYILRRVRPRSQTFTDRVAHAIVATLCTAQGAKPDIATLRGLHPRTLQRRLSAEGTTFADVRETVLQRTTHRFLTETDLPIAQIASALGYSEQAAVTRACRRWFRSHPDTNPGSDKVIP